MRSPNTSTIILESQETIPLQEPQTQDSNSSNALTQTQFILAYTGLLSAVFLHSLDGTILSPAFSLILSDLGKETLLPWLGVYMLTSAAFGIMYGKVSMLVSKKHVFLVALTLFLSGSLVCAVAPSMEVLVVGRAVAGIGGGGFLPLSYIAISEMTTAESRAKYNAILGAVMGIGSILGPLLGGLVSQYLKWRWCFYINFPLGLIAFVFIATSLNLPSVEKPDPRNLDVLGAITLLMTLMCFNIPILLGGTTWSWNSPQVISLFVLSVIGAVVFLWIEFYYARDPMLPPAIFKERWITATAGISFCFGAALSSYLFYFALLLEFIFGYSAVKTGGINVVTCTCYILFTIISGAIISKGGHYISFFIISPILWIISTVWVATFTEATDMAQLIISLVILGIAAGLISTTRVTAMQLHVAKEFIPITQGIASCSFTVGANVAISITGTILNNVLVSKTDGLAELHTVIDMLQQNGIEVTVSQYITLAKVLEAQLSSSGNSTALIQVALTQLKRGFNDAFKYAYLSHLVYLAGILLLVPVIWPKKSKQVVMA